MPLKTSDGALDSRLKTILVVKRILEPLARIPLFWEVFQWFLGGNREKMRILRQFFGKIGSDQPREKILEIGCSTGNIAPFFSNFDYTGIDTDAASIQRAKEKFAATQFRFLEGDVTKHPLISSEAYDYVLISHTAHHLTDEQFEKILRCCQNLLKTDGKLIVLDMVKPNHDGPFMKRFCQQLDRGEYIRNMEEFSRFFGAKKPFAIVNAQVIPCIKLGFLAMIDSCLIVATKPSL